MGNEEEWKLGKVKRRRIRGWVAAEGMVIEGGIRKKKRRKKVGKVQIGGRESIVDKLN